VVMMIKIMRGCQL